jgi:hypothetical protein
VLSSNPSALPFFSEFRMFSSNLIHRLLPLTRRNTRFLHASQSSLERIKRKSFTPTTSTTLSTSTTQTLPTTANQLLSHPTLIIGRQKEIGSILLGYEQANMYDIRLPTGEVIAHIAEQEKGVQGVVLRNILRTRRAFYSTVLDTSGNTLLKFSRPVKYLLNSSINVLDHLDTPLGSVHQSFHIWYVPYSFFTRRRRRYDLVNQQNAQFGLIDGNLVIN